MKEIFVGLVAGCIAVCVLYVVLYSIGYVVAPVLADHPNWTSNRQYSRFGAGVLTVVALSSVTIAVTGIAAGLHQFGTFVLRVLQINSSSQG